MHGPGQHFPELLPGELCTLPDAAALKPFTSVAPARVLPHLLPPVMQLVDQAHIRDGLILVAEADNPDRSPCRPKRDDCHEPDRLVPEFVRSCDGLSRWDRRSFDHVSERPTRRIRDAKGRELGFGAAG